MPDVPARTLLKGDRILIHSARRKVGRVTIITDILHGEQTTIKTGAGIFRVSADSPISTPNREKHEPYFEA